MWFTGREEPGYTRVAGEWRKSNGQASPQPSDLEKQAAFGSKKTGRPWGSLAA